MIKYFFILLFFLNTSQASDIINITFLGTGTPRPNIDKLGPSILLKYQNDEILFDVGRGTTLRLEQLNNNYTKIDNIFISHMHFDHIVGLADFWLTSSLWQKKTNTNIYGPKGIKKFCSQIKKLYEKDLSNKKCVPCEGGIPAFSIDQINDFLKKVDNWSVNEDEKDKFYLIKEFNFKNFVSSQDFVNNWFRKI